MVLPLCLALSSCKVGRFIYYNKAGIDDHKIFYNREIAMGKEAFRFFETGQPIAFKPILITTSSKNGRSKKVNKPFEKLLIDNQTVAFLVIRNDTLLYEKYFDGYDKESIINSFSIAKSFVSALIGCAIDDGYIDSIQQPVTDFIPELKTNGFDKVTIEHLLDMQSGIRFKEGYLNPFGHVASFYYGTNLESQVKRLKLETVPGSTTSYRSVDTQLLGMVLEKALVNKTLSQYLEERIWVPLQMEYPASWSLDQKGGREKAFCCINARARDLAKLGRLYLNKGLWNGKRIISEDWVDQSTKMAGTKEEGRHYNNQWWLYENQVFVAEGILGQFISVHPGSNMIFVRLGKGYGKDMKGAWISLFEHLENELR